MSHTRRPIVVLLVDDQAFIGVVVGRLLASEQDMELHCCVRSVEAVDRATELCPAVILQDLVMPDIDGLKLVELYRANPKTARTPVIVLSGNEDADGRTRALAAGANDYLIKLPAKDVLVACIRQHSAARAGAVPDRTTPPPLKIEAQTLDPQAVATLREVGAADSSDFFGSLVDQFIAEATSRVDVLKRAGFGRDVAGLKTTAHSLKGAANTMGASRLAALCTALEDHLERHPDCAEILPLIATVDEELDRVRDAFTVERRRVSHPTQG